MSEVKGLHTDEIEVPDKAQVAIDGGVVSVKGPLGEHSRKLSSPYLRITKEGGSVFVVNNTGRAKHRALLGTYAAHIRNMIHGVMEGFECRMRIVYAHFPIKASVKGDTFVIENFLGEFETVRQASFDSAADREVPFVDIQQDVRAIARNVS